MALGLQIGEVARQTGLTRDAIRFYEREKLLSHPVRSEGGFRLFSTRDVEHLRFIQQAQTLGFSLSEIRELLILQGDVKACAKVRLRLEEKVDLVREKIRQLQDLESRLAASLETCAGSLKGRRGGARRLCPVFPELTPGENERNA